MLLHATGKKEGMREERHIDPDYVPLPVSLFRHCATAAIERDLGDEAGCGSACFLIRGARLPDVTLKAVDTVLGILRSDTCSPKYA
jgi:hypothetical protein